MKHLDGRTTAVPVHPREEIDRRLLRKIASDIGIHPEEFMYIIDQTKVWFRDRPKHMVIVYQMAYSQPLTFDMENHRRSLVGAKKTVTIRLERGLEYFQYLPAVLVPDFNRMRTKSTLVSQPRINAGPRS